uniref:Uncharacterized protein n=1 Tax=Oryza brachyantha TaxID=4533 RepID=J3M6K2_ORYBR
MGRRKGNAAAPEDAGAGGKAQGGGAGSKLWNPDLRWYTRYRIIASVVHTTVSHMAYYNQALGQIKSLKLKDKN